jgi:hypothetical protein
MNADEPIAIYSFRLHAFVPERIYTLLADRLVWADLNEEGTAGKSDDANLSDIAELALCFAPSRFQSARCTANIVLRKDRSLLIASGHYQEIANFEDRRATFVPFVRAMAAQMARVNLKTKFTRGYRKFSLALGFILGTIGIAFIIMLLPIILAVGFAAFFPLAILLFGVPAAVASVRRNWPGTFDPFDVPPELLPDMDKFPSIDPAWAKIARTFLRR